MINDRTHPHPLAVYWKQWPPSSKRPRLTASEAVEAVKANIIIIIVVPRTKESTTAVGAAAAEFNSILVLKDDGLLGQASDKEAVEAGQWCVQ